MDPVSTSSTTHPEHTHTRARSERAERTSSLIAEAASSAEPRRSELLREVVVVNRGVADSVAARYRNRGVSDEDLQQVAYEGLTKAVQRFDPETGNDLLTFAVPTIRGELQRYFRDQGWTVRPPRRIQELQWRVRHELDHLTQELGCEPDRAQVVEALDITEEDYDDAQAAAGCFQTTSLDQPATLGSPTPVGERLVVEDEELTHTDDRVSIAPVVRRLPRRDREILYLRFVEDLTQAEIGEEIGVTQMQVSRLLSRILGRIREDLEAPPPGDPGEDAHH